MIKPSLAKFGIVSTFLIRWMWQKLWVRKVLFSPYKPLLVKIEFATGFQCEKKRYGEIDDGGGESSLKLVIGLKQWEMENKEG